jgi:hypothetical protein
VATEADDITADMEITELNRRDAPAVRFNPPTSARTSRSRLGSAPARPLWRHRPNVQLRFQDGEPRPGRDTHQNPY